LMPLGFGEINTTTVYPQARYSDRVPFGTGRSMLEYEKNRELNTYNFQIFLELKIFFDALNKWEHGDFENWKSHCSSLLLDFLVSEQFDKARIEAIKNTTNKKNAKERLLKWFSGFCIIKCIHFMTQSGLSELPVVSEAKKLISMDDALSTRALLNIFREQDRR
jgi:hypothetical protein